MRILGRVFCIAFAGRTANKKLVFKNFEKLTEKRLTKAHLFNNIIRLYKRAHTLRRM